MLCWTVSIGSAPFFYGKIDGTLRQTAKKDYIWKASRIVRVAQLDRVSVSETEGHEFDSRRGH